MAWREEGLPGSPPYSAAVVSTDGEIHELVPGIPTDASNLEFSPDGQTIAFMRQNDCGQSDGMGRISGFSTPRRTLRDRTPEATLKEGVAWSPDGTRIAFVLGEDIYVMPTARTCSGPDDGAWWRLPARVVLPGRWRTDTGRAPASTWASELGGLHDARGGRNTTTRLTHDDMSSIAPAWSPTAHRSFIGRVASCR